MSRMNYQSLIAPQVKILVVDDNEINLKIVVGLLSPYQCEVKCVTSGHDAIETLQRELFDLVLMDYLMPEMDGIEATLKIRNLHGEYFTTIPIIAVTASVVGGSQNIFLSNGFNDYVTKPIEPLTLDRMLLNWIPKDKRILLKRDTTENKTQPETVTSVQNVTKTGQETSIVSRLEFISSSSLLDAGIGIKYAGGNRAGYHDILRAFIASLEESVAKLRTLVETKNWYDFSLQAHAIKSFSQTIGAIPLSYFSLKMEEAGKEGYLSLIIEQFESYLELYKATAQEINNYLDKTSMKF